MNRATRLVRPTPALRPLRRAFAQQSIRVPPRIASSGRVSLIETPTRRLATDASPKEDIGSKETAAQSSNEASENAEPVSQPARYPWRFSFEPPFPPPPASLFARVLAPIKRRHFLNLGLQRAKRHLPSEIANGFPENVLEEAPIMIHELFRTMARADAPEDTFRTIASPILASRLIVAAAEAEQLGLDVQFDFPTTVPTKLEIQGYRFIYGPRSESGEIPSTHVRTPWFDGLVTFIVPKEEAEFKHHNRQREVVLTAMKEGAAILVDVKASDWKVGMEILEDEAGDQKTVVKDEKDGVVVTLESSRFFAGAKGEKSRLVDEEGGWTWKVGDLDYMLAQEMSEI